MTAPNPLDETEVGDFVNKVDEISRLIDGLSKGTISPDYVDRKVEQSKLLIDKETSKEEKRAPSKLPEDEATRAAREKKEKEDKEKEDDRRARLEAKAADLKANYERKLKARARFDEYVKAGSAPQANVGTDYTKWDMWCPEDEEDDLINSITPTHNAAFRAMEKDIDERHRK